MSHHHLLEDYKEEQQPHWSHRRPMHDFYVIPPAGLMLNHNNENIISSSNHNRDIATARLSPPRATPTEEATMIYTAIVPTHRVIHYGSSSTASSYPSNIPSSTASANTNNKMSPPLINNSNNVNNDQTPTSSNRENADELPWLAPLLGVLGTLGVVGIVILFVIGRKKKKTRRGDNEDNSRSHPYTQQLSSNIYQSWASLSTINTSPTAGPEEEKKYIIHDHVPPPPAYTTSVRQKRLTADTLVDESATSAISLMLKNQYSPQLAFSPSLVAGEFQQQQQLENEKPPLPLQQQTISPSNTLIDNAGIIHNNISTKKTTTESYHYSFDQRPKRIEIYEPQVNLSHNNSDATNPFIPYPYTNEDNEDQSTKHIINEDDSKSTHQHHVVDMSNNNKS